MRIMKFVLGLIHKYCSFIDRIRCKYLLLSFKNHGDNCHIDGLGSFGSENISCGNNVFIGAGCFFLCSEAEIVIGNNVMFGPHVMIATGNHRVDVIGKYMTQVHNKLPENDASVIIEDDCWIGMGAIILRGVTIGTGSVIGAGSIVTGNVAPYSIVTGVKTQKSRERFNLEQIEEHEKILKETQKCFQG